MRWLLVLFTNNWKLKVFSIAISVGLFIFVRSDKDSEGTLTVDIEYINPPGEQVLLNELIPQVKLALRGPWMGVRRLDGAVWERKLRVDLASIRADRFDLDSTMFPLPKGIRIMSISPQYLPIRMEERIQRPVPITLKVESDRDHTVTETTLEPNRVMMSGPRSLVLSFATLPLPTHKVEKDGQQEFMLPLPELPASIFLEPAVREVKVRISVEKAISVRQFSNITLAVRGAGNRVQVEPRVVDITVEGPRKTLYLLQPSSIIPYVELLRNPPENEYFAPVLLEKLPPEFHFRVMPSQVRVKLP